MIDAGQWLAEVAHRWQCGPVADTPASAISLIADRHGAAGERFGQLAVDHAGPRSELFAAKNASLGLSLDAAMLWSGELYRQELPLVAEAVRRINPKRIVDVGCEQGLVTCLAAAAAPDSLVVGIDPCAQAIARADELAAALGIRNVEFICSDPLMRDADQEGFDLLIESRAMLGEALANCDYPAELLPGELPAAAEWQAAATAAAAALAQLIKPTGHALLIERTDTTGVVRWATALATAGVATIGPHRALRVDEPGGQASFRVLHAKRVEPSSPMQPQDLFAPVGIPEPGSDLDGESAEAAALHLRPATAPSAWEWTNSNGDRERIELVGSTEGDLIELRCSTNGERTLCVHHGCDEAAVRARTKRFVEASAGANLSTVQSILPAAHAKIEF